MDYTAQLEEIISIQEDIQTVVESVYGVLDTVNSNIVQSNQYAFWIFLLLVFVVLWYEVKRF